MAFEQLLDPILSPFLKMNPFLAILILSFLISLAITVIYKYVTDQKRMKELKDKINANQKKLKELKNNPQKSMVVQKETMSINMEMMKHSFKPTLITLIPIIIIFGWLNNSMAFEPIQPGQEFTNTLIFANGIIGNITTVVPMGVEVIGDKTKTIQDNTAVFNYRGEKGDYIIQYKYGERAPPYQKEIRINELRYAPPVKIETDGTLKTITTNNKQLIVMNLLGWKLGWLGTYIIWSIILSMVLRKLLKVY